MITAVDSSALFSIFNAEQDAARWHRFLTKRGHEGRLVICDIVYAEVSAAFAERSEIDSALDRLKISFSNSNQESLHLAGRTFIQYRRSGGPRSRMIPDFIIGAHATIQCDCLAAKDRGYLRQYFRRLNLATP